MCETEVEGNMLFAPYKTELPTVFITSHSQRLIATWLKQTPNVRSAPEAQ